MFCPKCGKTGRGLCVDCYLKLNPVIVGEVAIEVCGCGRVKQGTKWVNDLAAVVSEESGKAVKFPEKIKVVDVSVVPKPKKNQVFWDAVFTAEFEGERVKEDIPLNCRIIKTVCPSCSRGSSGYFEAVLQVREKNPKVYNKPEDISAVRSVRGGIDVHVKSVSSARQIAKKYERMGYAVGVSETLFGKKDGKDVYRVYYSIKPPPYRVGEIREFKGRLYRVESWGRKVSVSDAVTHERKTVPAKSFEKSRLIAGNDDAKKSVVSSKTPREIQALELDSGEVYSIAVSKDFMEGDEVDLFLIGGKPFIFKKSE